MKYFVNSGSVAGRAGAAVGERTERPAASRRRVMLASLPPQVRLRGVRRRARRGRRRVRAEREGPVRGASDRGARPGPPPRQLVRCRTQ